MLKLLLLLLLLLADAAHTVRSGRNTSSTKLHRSERGRVEGGAVVAIADSF